MKKIESEKQTKENIFGEMRGTVENNNFSEGYNSDESDDLLVNENHTATKEFPLGGLSSPSDKELQIPFSPSLQKQLSMINGSPCQGFYPSQQDNIPSFHGVNIDYESSDTDDDDQKGVGESENECEGTDDNDNMEQKYGFTKFGDEDEASVLNMSDDEVEESDGKKPMTKSKAFGESSKDELYFSTQISLLTTTASELEKFRSISGDMLAELGMIKAVIDGNKVLVHVTHDVEKIVEQARKQREQKEEMEAFAPVIQKSRSKKKTPKPKVKQEEVIPIAEGTFLFLENGKVLGKISEVMGPVSSPFYIIRYETPELAALVLGVQQSELQKIGSDNQKIFQVYYTCQSEYTTFLNVPSIIYSKGSDATGERDIELPEHLMEHSDDEEERAAKKRRKFSPFSTNHNHSAVNNSFSRDKGKRKTNKR